MSHSQESRPAAAAYRYRRLQRLEGANMDAYRPGRKPRGPVVCGTCRAVFRRGRWAWTVPPAGATRVRCPACWRTAERMPGGILDLGGGFLRQHRTEVLGLLGRCEAKENATHPLERVMGRRAAGGGVVVNTTSAHLARRMAHALRRAFKGELTQSYGTDGVLRVNWRREA
jgi:hypothetical protein